jgi:hypothetical protein
LDIGDQSPIAIESEVVLNKATAKQLDDHNLTPLLDVLSTPLFFGSIWDYQKLGPSNDDLGEWMPFRL